MLETPKILQTADQLTAIIPLTVPRTEIQNVMGPGFGELIAVVSAQSAGPAGCFFNHHLRMHPAVFDFEISVPVTKPVEATGRVRPGRLPARKVARTVYCGPYEGLGDAWCEFGKWIEAQGLTPDADLWECYLAGPESSSDPASWRTELNRPLVD